MDAKERYFWDLTGYLVAKAVLSPDEVAHANEIVDRYSNRIRVGGSTARASLSARPCGTTSKTAASSAAASPWPGSLPMCPKAPEEKTWVVKK